MLQGIEYFNELAHAGKQWTFNDGFYHFNIKTTTMNTTNVVNRHFALFTLWTFPINLEIAMDLSNMW